jgi:fibronectin-binding autotransporter adhesin
LTKADAFLIQRNTSAARPLVFGGAGNIFVSGDISAANTGTTLTKVGTGTLTLGGANAYTGGTTLSAGALWAQGAGSLGTGALTLDSGTLELAGNTGQGFTNPTTMGGDVFIVSDRLSAGAGVTHTLGPLAIGTETVTVAAGSHVTSGTAGLPFGATTVTGDAIFAVGVNTLFTPRATTFTDGVTVTLGRGGSGGVTVAGFAGTAGGAWAAASQQAMRASSSIMPARR